MIKISIITPVKNGSTFLSECMESVFRQQGNFSVEYLIIDGSSTDGTLAKIEQFKKKVDLTGREDFTLIAFSEKDNSMYEALVKGFKLCTGDIIAYLNSDDFYLDNAFQMVVHCFQQEKVSWLTGKPINFNEEDQSYWSVLPNAYYKYLIKHGQYNGKLLPFIQQENVFFRSKLLQNLNLEGILNYKLAGDAWMWNEFAKTNKLFICRDSFATARIHKNRLSANKRMYFKEFNSIFSEKTIVITLLSIIQFLYIKIVPEEIKIKLSKSIIS